MTSVGRVARMSNWGRSVSHALSAAPILGLVALLGFVGCSEGETGVAATEDLEVAAGDSGQTSFPSFSDTSRPGGSDLADGDPRTAPDADAEPDSPEIPPPAPDSEPDAPAQEVAQPDLGPCIPLCQAKNCGADGCGGLCGTCGQLEICTGAGICAPDPSAGCAGLELAEHWAGTFDGDASFNILYKLVPIDGSAHGNMSFSISCLNSKYIVSGTMEGTASNNDFALGLSGTYNPQTKTLTAKVVDGTVFVLAVVTYFEFAGDIVGTLGPDGTFTGTLDVEAVSATTLFTLLDPATYSAWAKCDWDAAPQ
jgi:hypothetical protein